MSKSFGLLAKFEKPADIMHAAEKVRDAGFKRWDVITPFPIHGMDPAMGLHRSMVPRFTIVGGTVGFLTGMIMIWWMNAFDYGLIVGGKPLFSPIYAFPVSYELTILFSAFASIIGMFILNRLPRHYHPVMKYEKAAEGMDDKFFLYIEAEDPQFEREKTRAFLGELGPSEVSELEE